METEYHTAANYVRATRIARACVLWAALVYESWKNQQKQGGMRDKSTLDKRQKKKHTKLDG